MLPILSKKILIPEHFWNTGVPLKKIVLQWNKKIRRRIVIPFPPPVIHKFCFHTRNFLQIRRLPHEDFCHADTENCDGNPDTAINWKIFRYQKFSETQNGSPTNFFWHWNKKNCQNCDTPIIQKLFETRTFLKHEGTPYETFRYSETKIFAGKTCYPPPPLIQIFLSKAEKFLNSQVFLHENFLPLWDWKFPTRKRDNFPLIHIFSPL